MKVPEEPVSAASFEDLALPLFDQLYNFARWLTQDTAEAEDLVQETYTKALRGFSSFQLGTNFRAWMYRILRNSFLSSRTGLRTTVTIDGEADENLLAAESSTPESILIEQADRVTVQQALA
jgi:RNA polymerase sigma-70 factor (ECF subfamily)